jgi:hypothetical protein
MKKFVVLAILAGAVIVIFALGILSWDTVGPRLRYLFFRGQSEARQAFATSDLKNVEHAKICRENLRMIESAKRRVAQDRGQAIGDVSWGEVLKAMNRTEIPKCPDGGEYILGPLGSLPRCTIGGNGTIRVEDDHIIEF